MIVVYLPIYPREIPVVAYVLRPATVRGMGLLRQVGSLDRSLDRQQAEGLSQCHAG